ncbi:MAG: hypothetical protein H0T70_04840 [Acidimicrobiia bacterium]|nr:hypothetical protein [Acidimicrobiia bacterium]
MEERDDLNDLLAQAADPPPATADSFRGVMVRYRRGRTRALLATLVAVALLGPAVGVAVGRATTDHPTQVATGASPEAAPSDGSPDPTERDSLIVPGPPPGGLAPYFGGESPPPPTRLFVRTTADGVTMRVYLQENLPGGGDAECADQDGPVPCPVLPPECAPPGAQLLAGLSNDAAVDPGFVPVVTAGTTEPVVMLQSSYFGVLEGKPAAWVAVKADDQIARVRVTFSDGAVDEMAPVGGYAVLAHHTAAPAAVPTGPASSPEEWEALLKASLPQGSLEALDADGTAVATADLASVPSHFSSKCAMEGGPKPLLPEEDTVSPVPVAPPGSVPPSPITTRP